MPIVVEEKEGWLRSSQKIDFLIQISLCFPLIYFDLDCPLPQVPCKDKAKPVPLTSVSFSPLVALALELQPTASEGSEALFSQLPLRSWGVLNSQQCPVPRRVACSRQASFLPLLLKLVGERWKMWLYRDKVPLAGAVCYPEQHPQANTGSGYSLLDISLTSHET